MTSLQVLWAARNPLAHIVCKFQNSKKVSYSEAETHLRCRAAGPRSGREYLGEAEWRIGANAKVHTMKSMPTMNFLCRSGGVNIRSC